MNFRHDRRAHSLHLGVCERHGIDVLTATKEHVSLYVHDLTSRPNPRGKNIRMLDSKVGLANATLHQYLTAIRLWYDYLMEEGIRADHPAGRGHYTSSKGFASFREKGLTPTYKKCPGCLLMSNGMRF